MWERPGEMSVIACSLVVSVLESYDIVRRQCRHIQAILPDDWELILLDDGSQPPLPLPAEKPSHLTVVYTRNATPWTQPIARNLGARLSRGKYFFFTDIDHILSREAVKAVHDFTGSRMLFPRSFGMLDENGRLLRDVAAIRAHGGNKKSRERSIPATTVHQNTFAIRRDLFLDAMHGGYDESLCAEGKYGGDDVEFNQRYARLVTAGRADPDVFGPEIYVYPDPASSTQFHSLARREGSNNSVRNHIAAF